MVKCWLGIDCGSVSIKLALVNNLNEVIDSVYLKNKGVIETIQKGLKHFQNKNYEVMGVGTTGSGREFISLLIGSDIVKTEILAHTIATLHFYPKVKTIMDIGGEDCKIMEVRDGVLNNFIMNNICGAGTGAVIESIASRLGISIEDVGDLALSSQQRLDFPGKCGIFCQSAVVNKLNTGANKSDIMAGVVRALAGNYLTLARGITMNPPYVFQGATAKNKALVKALEEQLNHKIIVPKECDIMGAIGISLLTKEAKVQKTKFKGFDNQEFNHKTLNFKCLDCPNKCEVTQLYGGEKLLGAIGTRCGKWNTLRYKKEQQKDVLINKIMP